MTFSYVAYNLSGKKIKDTINASNLQEAKKTLENGSLIVESIKEKKSLFRRDIDNKTLALFSRNLSIYLKSGVPLTRALFVSASTYENNKKMKQFVDSLYHNIKTGMSFSRALTEQNLYNIPHFYKYTIEIAEKSSNLQKVLIEMATFMLNTEKVKQEVAKAFIYPSFIILVSIAMVNFMLSSIVPKIVGIFKSTNSELPTATKITLFLSNILKDYSSLILTIFVLLVVSFIALYKTHKSFRLAIDTTMLKVPLFGTITENFELGRFAKITSLLLSSGVPFAQAINFSSKVYENYYLRDIFDKISKNIVEGKSFSQALALQTNYKAPTSLVNSISLGENSSELSYSLEMLSEIYENENRDKIDILLSLLEPILMLIVGGIIGFIVISMLLPIFSISVQ